MTTKPKQTPKNGRAPGGRFAVGNQCAVGHSSKGKRLRAAMIKALDETDIAAIIQAMVEQARAGDVRAAKLIFDIVGKPDLADASATESPAVALQITQANFQEVKRALLESAN